MEELVALIDDTLILHGRVVETQISTEIDTNEVFVALTEDARRIRHRKLNSGDMTANLQINIPQDGYGQGYGYGMQNMQMYGNQGYGGQCYGNMGGCCGNMGGCCGNNCGCGYNNMGGKMDRAIVLEMVASLERARETRTLTESFVAEFRKTEKEREDASHWDRLYLSFHTTRGFSLLIGGTCRSWLVSCGWVKDDASPKRRRAEGEGATRGAIKKKNKLSSDSFNWEAFKQLLGEHKDQIVKETREQAHDMVKALDRKVETKLSAVGDQMQAMNERLRGVEEKLTRLEDGRRGGTSGDMDERRRNTLVLGGWNMDTPRGTILAEVEEALEKLGLAKFTDSRPFTTGPRRSVALLNFDLRPGEADADRRRRMHEIVSGVAEAKPFTSHKRRLWASYSKSKTEREIASHCSWLKRTLASFNRELLNHVDAEYGTGTVWLGDSVVASATRTLPENTSEDGVLWDDNKPGRRPWIWIEGIAKFSGITAVGIQEAREASTKNAEADLANASTHFARGKVNKPCRQGQLPLLQAATFPFVSWNLGGASVTDYPRVVTDVMKKLPSNALLSFQEIPRDLSGWHTTYHGSWTLIQHRGDEVWRGTGIAYNTAAWKVMRKKATPRGIWLRLRSTEGSEVWIGLPPTTIPVLFSCDLNAELAWGYDEVSRRGLLAIPPPPHDFGTPTSRKRARRHWEQDRLDKATAGDWGLIRQLRPTKNQGWDISFAEAQDGRDPHEAIHAHLQGIYTTGLVLPPATPWEGGIEPFTADELTWALGKGRFNKAVGVDGTSHELLQGLTQLPGGFNALLDFYNEVYATAAIPSDWNAALMIVIPKEVMGIQFRVGASCSELIAPLIARGRVKLLDKIVGGTSLWHYPKLSNLERDMDQENALADPPYVIHRMNAEMFDYEDSPESHPEDEKTTLMQQVPLQDWYLLLADLQRGLEALPKAERAVAILQLLRWLDYTATNKRQGYMLGHMQGKPGDATALLVAALEDTGIQPEGEAHQWCSPWVLEMRVRLRAHIPRHAGSDDSWGEPMQMGMPCIMLFNKPLPSNTPPTTPDAEQAAIEVPSDGETKKNKRRCILVELSSGSSDLPRVARQIRVPLHEGRAELHMAMQVEDDVDSEASTKPVEGPATAPLGGSTGTTSFCLPEPAPGTLAEAGLSMTDLLSLWGRWRTGSMGVNDVKRIHGQVAAEFVQEQWVNLPAEALELPSIYPDHPLNDLMMLPNHPEVTDNDHALEAEGSAVVTADTEVEVLENQGTTPAAGDTGPFMEQSHTEEETVLFALFLRLLPMVPKVTAPESPVVCEPSPLQLARDWVAWLRRAGVSNLLLTTALLAQAERRRSLDYIQDWETILMELHLTPEADMDRVAEVPEQEVMNARAQATMSLEDRGRWANRASRRDFNLDLSDGLTVGQDGAEAHHPTTARTSQDGEDAFSLMERTRRRMSSRDREESEEDRPRRPREGRPNTRGSGSGLDRSRTTRGERCTTEVRRLEPRRPTPRPRPTPTRATVPTMSLDAATAQWLHFLGLRRGPDSQSLQPALPNTAEQLQWIDGLHEQDMPTVMGGLLRVLAMLMVECSQLLMTRQASFMVAVPVDDEEDDDVLYMQQSQLWKRRKPDEPTDAQLQEEHYEAAVNRRQQAERDRQQEDHEREEEAWNVQEEAHAAQLWQELQASNYRDWEQWEVLNQPAAAPRRQRIRLTATSGAGVQAPGSSTDVGVVEAAAECVVPRLRGGRLVLRIEMEEVGLPRLPETNEGEPTAPDAQQTADTQLSAESGHEVQATEELMEAKYRAWLKGEIKDAEVLVLLGQDALTSFLAQWMVDNDGDAMEEDSQQETLGMQERDRRGQGRYGNEMEEDNHQGTLGMQERDRQGQGRYEK
ncbi:ANKRD50 [Symbiodinium sp. CCMP2456]|nr:ANKRD50 [Symbiodinium sp. CCMP2456]